MKKVNPKMGRQRIHTIACYDDIWKKIHELKKYKHTTIDGMLRMLVDDYMNSNVEIYENVKKSINDHLDDKIKEIQKESKNL